MSNEFLFLLTEVVVDIGKIIRNVGSTTSEHLIVNEVGVDGYVSRKL